MPEVDYAILSEFYKWILDQEDTKIDLIGKVEMLNIHVH